MSVNRTLNVGSNRVISMEMLSCAGKGEEWQTVNDTAVDFTVSDGTEFALHTSDEVLCARKVPSGDIVNGAWFHGMQTPVKADEISCGFIGREVNTVCDVRVCDDVVLTRPLDPKRQSMYDRAQSVWIEQEAALFSQRVSGTVKCAVKNWSGNVRRSARKRAHEDE